MTTYDPTTALIVVDVQNDFADPAGNLSVAEGEKVVPFINDQVETAVRGGSTVIYTQDWHPPDTPHFAKDGGPWPVHCVAGTWGAELHPQLIVRGDTVRKGTGGEDGYSGFTVRDPETGSESPTGLEEQLRARDLRRVVIVGLATDYCVKETAIDSARLGFETVVLGDGIRAVNLNPGDEEAALGAMRVAGVSIDSSGGPGGRSR